MKRCHYCGEILDDVAPACPACGSPDRAPTWRWVWVPLLVLGIVGLLGWACVATCRMLMRL